MVQRGLLGVVKTVATNKEVVLGVPSWFELPAVLLSRVSSVLRRLVSL